MPKKVHLFQVQLHFLGHIVSQNGVVPNDEKVKVVKDWPIPKNSK
jgi:hypothetical protein